MPSNYIFPFFRETIKKKVTIGYNICTLYFAFKLILYLKNVINKACKMAQQEVKSLTAKLDLKLIPGSHTVEGITS